MDLNHIRIAVIGLGPAGLTALKTLREEGFDAVGFERRAHAGGLWAYNADKSYTSVISETVTNVSKFISGFSDFPIPEGYPTYFAGSDVAQYLGEYVRHFGLEPYCRLGTIVRRVIRSSSGTSWEVHVSTQDGDSILHFDKVVFGTGSNTVPKWPDMPGIDMFKGAVIHGQHFKRPDEFAGKRVMVVGLGNTACETALSLTKHCKQVFQAYRRGRVLISRYHDDGSAIDSTLSWATVRLKYLLDYWLPWLTIPLVDKFMVRKMTSDIARHEPTGLSSKERFRRAQQKVLQWRLTPCPSMARQNPVVQDIFIPALILGQITPVRGFKEFIGADEVLLEDDSIVAVDAVIFCTGYSVDFSIMPELEMDGAGFLPKVTVDTLTDSQEPHLPRLYKMIFPPRYASSIAFLSWMVPQENVWCVCELAAMAVAQIWAAEFCQSPPSGCHPARLPPTDQMNQDIDEYHTWWREHWRKDHSMHHGFVQAHTLFRFLHEKAGTGMYGILDHIFTSSGWRLWWYDKELYTWLSKGPMNSYAWRLRDNNPERIPGCGRKAWPGAREAIRNAFLEYNGYKKALNTPRGSQLRKEALSSI